MNGPVVFPTFFSLSLKFVIYHMVFVFPFLTSLNLIICSSICCIKWNWFCFLWLCSIPYREGNGTPLQYSCLENPMNRGAWWAAVYGVVKSQTQLRDFTFTFHFHALEKAMAPHSSVLAWRIPGTEEPDRLPSMGSHRVGHDWSDLAAAAVLHVYMYTHPTSFLSIWPSVDIQPVSLSWLLWVALLWT